MLLSSFKTSLSRLYPMCASGFTIFLCYREQQSQAKVISNMVKQKRKEKAGKWEVPIPTVR